MTMVLTVEEKADAVRRYLAGETQQAIGDRYGVTRWAIRGILVRRNVPLRPSVEWNRLYEIDETVFDVLSPDARYWCGFIAADGHLKPSKRGRGAALEVGLARRDRGHLVKLLAFLRSTHPIRDYMSNGYGGTTPASRISVTADRMVHYLAELGLKEGDPPIELTDDRHFWRGVVDGDGSFEVTGPAPRFDVAGRRDLLGWFTRFIAAKGLSAANVTPHHSIWRVGTSFGGARRIVQELYRDAPIALDRKAAAAAASRHCG